MLTHVRDLSGLARTSSLKGFATSFKFSKMVSSRLNFKKKSDEL